MEARLELLRREIKEAPSDHQDDPDIETMPFKELIKEVYGDYLLKLRKPNKRKSKTPSKIVNTPIPSFSSLKPYVLTMMMALDCNLSLEVLYKNFPLVSPSAVKGPRSITYNYKRRTLDGEEDIKDYLPNQVSIDYGIDDESYSSDVINGDIAHSRQEAYDNSVLKSSNLTITEKSSSSLKGPCRCEIESFIASSKESLSFCNKDISYDSIGDDIVTRTDSTMSFSDSTDDLISSNIDSSIKGIKPKKDNSMLLRFFYNKLEIIKSKSTESVLKVWTEIRPTLLKIKNLYDTKPSKEVSLDIQMANYKFNLGFNVDRQKTADIFGSYKHISCQFTPSLLSSIIIRYPITGKRYNGEARTFFIFFSGSCVYVSRGSLEESERVFNEFIEIIKENKDRMALCVS